MNRFPLLLLLLLSLISGGLLAEETDICQDQPESCTTVGVWRISAAFGLGVRTNPLGNSDNLPLIILPKITYYGESFYLDNLDFGFSLPINQQQSLSIYATPNTDHLYFTHTDPTNYAQSGAINEGSGTSSDIAPKNLSRDFSYYAGLKWQQVTEPYQLELAALSDITNVHHGFELRAKLQTVWKIDNWIINPSLGLNWKSQAVTNYYYGLDAQDTSDSTLWYETTSSWQSAIQLNLIKQLKDDYSLLVKIKAETWHGDVTQSPLFKESTTYLVFIGVMIDF